jgi:hypothetical protein
VPKCYLALEACIIAIAKKYGINKEVKKIGYKVCKISKEKNGKTCFLENL